MIDRSTLAREAKSTGKLPGGEIDGRRFSHNSLRGVLCKQHGYDAARLGELLFAAKLCREDIVSDIGAGLRLTEERHAVVIPDGDVPRPVEKPAEVHPFEAHHPKVARLIRKPVDEGDGFRTRW